jgi:hypothetical protein
MAEGWLGVTRCGAVDAAGSPLGSAAGHLVRHGVGEALDRPPGVQDVPVKVDEAVQLHEGPLAVATQQGQGDRSKVAPGDGHRVGDRRR